MADAGFLVAGLLAWQSSDRVHWCVGLLGFRCLVFVLQVVSVAMIWEFAVASPQPLVSAFCFKTLGTDQIDGFWGCWVFCCSVYFY